MSVFLSRQHRRRWGALSAIPVAVSLQLPMAAVYAQAARQAFDIPAQSMSGALRTYAAQTGLQVLFNAQDIAGLQAPALRGSYTPEEALQRLIGGTSLELIERDGGITLRRRSAAADMLSPVTVIGRPSATTEGTGSYASPAATISKLDIPWREDPQSVSVVTQQRMQDQNLTTIKDVLENAPGVSAVASFPGTQFYSRGFMIKSFQYDGVPLERELYARGSSFSGQTAIYDRIEILRGPQGLLEGAGNPSGSVNMVRKRPTTDAAFSATVKAGTWHHYGAQLDGGGALDEAGRVRGRLVWDYDTTHSFVDYKEATNQTFYGALDIDLTSDTTLGLGFSRELLDSTPDVMGLPNYSDGSIPNFRRSKYLGAPWSYWDKRQDTYYLDLEHHFNENWRVKVSAIRVREYNDFKYIQRRGRLGPPNTLVGDAYRFDYSSDHTGIDAHVNGKLDLFDRELDITLGGNYSKLKGDHVWGVKYGVESLTNILDYSAEVQEPSDAEIYAANRWLDNYYSRKQGWYGMARYRLAEPFAVIAGARVSSYRNIYDSDGPWGVSSTEASKSSRVTPFFGMTYDLGPRWTAYASYSEIYNPQSQRNVDGEFLDPLEGRGYEIGLKGTLLDDKLNASFAMFSIDQKNVALQDGTVAGSVAQVQCGGTCYTAGAKLRSRGFEAELDGEIVPGLQLYAAYTFNQVKYVGDAPAGVADNITASVGVPKHIVRAWANYRLPGEWSRVSIGGGVTSQSRSSAFGYYNREQPGYTVWDARIGYQFSKQLTGAVSVNNVFDKKYYQSVSYDHNFYGEPRSVLLTLQYQM